MRSFFEGDAIELGERSRYGNRVPASHVPMHWFTDPEVTRRLPILYRAYAWYTRAVFHESKPVRGGSFLLSMLIGLTNHLGLTKQAVVKVGGLAVCLDLCDHHMLSVYGEMGNSSTELRIVESSLSPGDTFLDVGANHGSLSLIAARAVGPSGVVAAFEPQPRLASLIRQSFAANRFESCTVHEIACSDHEGEAEFHIPSTDSGAGSIYEGLVPQDATRRITVRTRRLDDAVDWRRLPGRVFLKLDIEGSEFAFLGGATEMIANRQPIILLEINPTTARASGHSVEELLERLSRLGYSRFSEVDRYPATVPWQEVDCTRQRNLVALPNHH